MITIDQLIHTIENSIISIDDISAYHTTYAAYDYDADDWSDTTIQYFVVSFTPFGLPIAFTFIGHLIDGKIDSLESLSDDSDQTYNLLEYPTLVVVDEDGTPLEINKIEQALRESTLADLYHNIDYDMLETAAKTSLDTSTV